MEYWRPTNLVNIERGAALPLRIDPQTLALSNGLLARVLVDIHLASSLPEKILVKRSELNFFVSVMYENLPHLCTGCGSIGHTIAECRKDKGGITRFQQSKVGSRLARAMLNPPLEQNQKDAEIAQNITNGKGISSNSETTTKQQLRTQQGTANGQLMGEARGYQNNKTTIKGKEKENVKEVVA